MAMKLSDSLKELSHHAYCLIGNSSIKDELVSILTKVHKIKVQGNPDLFARDYQTFSIDDAREVKAFAGTRPVDDPGKKIFVLTMNGITVEAQNGLLKLLEEPPQYAHFFLIIPSAYLLLPTVKSRITLIGDAGIGNESSNEISEMASEFMKAAPKERLEIIKSLMEEITKEKRSKQDALDLMNALEESIHGKGVKKNVAALEAIINARKYMNDRAPSLKMLLEYVALNV